MFILWIYTLVSISPANGSGQSGEPRFLLGNRSRSYDGTVKNTSFATAVSGVGYQGYKLKYNISFLATDCCPFMHIHNAKSAIHDNKCFPDEFLDFEVSLNNNLVGLYHCCDSTNGVNDTCVCTGERFMQLNHEYTWNVTFGYTCSKVNEGLKLNLHYNITFTDLLQGQLVDFPKTIECRHFVKHKRFLLPNMFGHTKIDEKLTRDTFFLMKIAEILTCYKHAHNFTCAMLFPSINNESTIMQPCRSACEDLLAGCTHVMQQKKMWLTCGWFLDSTDQTKCYSMPVTCDHPVVPPNGFIEGLSGTETGVPGQRVKLNCSAGFSAVPQNGEIICMHSGLWEPDYYCNRTLSNAVKYVPSLTPFAVVGTGVATCLLFLILCLVSYKIYIKRQSHKIFYTFNIRSSGPTAYRYDIFVSYDSEDTKFIYRGNDCLRLALEQKGYLICLHGRDFLPGNVIESNILGAVEQSKTGICLISGHYLKSEWCLWEFALFRHQQRINPHFKMILVLLEDETILARASNVMLDYVKRFVYLKASDEHFQNKLLQALPKPVCAKQQGVVPGGVHPVLTDHLP